MTTGLVKYGIHGNMPWLLAVTSDHWSSQGESTVRSLIAHIVLACQSTGRKFAQLARFSGISLTVIHFKSFFVESVKDSDGTAYSVIGTTTEGINKFIIVQAAIHAWCDFPWTFKL